MRRLGVFAVMSAVVIAAVAWALGLRFAAPAEHRAIVISAGVAYVVQLFTFAMVRRAAMSAVVVRWQIGVLLRFVILVAYGLVLVKPFGLPVAAAMISLALFFFLSTLLEPVFLFKS